MVTEVCFKTYNPILNDSYNISHCLTWGKKMFSFYLGITTIFWFFNLFNL